MAESHHHKTMKRTHLKTTTCTNPFCLFCSINEPSPSPRRTGLSRCFKEMTSSSDQEQEEYVLVLSVLFNLAVNQPNDPEFLYLGIFECMSKLIQRVVDDKSLAFKRPKHLYIPYYAAHIIGSYTMNRADFAGKAVGSGVVLPLTELLRGKISWVEQRVAVRALWRHLVSHEKPSNKQVSIY